GQETRSLHADADHPEADPVTGCGDGAQTMGQRHDRVRGERCTGGSRAQAQKFAARAVVRFHGVSKVTWLPIMHRCWHGTIGSRPSSLCFGSTAEEATESPRP